MKKNIKIGSSITFLDSVDSTNNYTANLINEKKIENGQVIMADYQGEGRGQRGSIWHSERGKNILVSFYLEMDNAPTFFYMWTPLLFHHELPTLVLYSSLLIQEKE